ncbi:MAG: hypothetical protein ACE5LH_00455 [Fidelibacterota bacterium]
MRRLVTTAVILFTAAKTALVAQEATLDWKLHDVGKVRQLVTNMGTLWAAFTDYDGLIYCEFPPNSFEEHIGESGIWVGALTAENDTLVSSTTIWANPHFEFYPSAEPWDTVWVVTRGDTADIPYWPNYTAVSDQDFVCRYSDDNVTNIGDHTPLYLDVIQTSYAWSSPPLDEMIVFTFHVIPTQIELRDAYLAYWMDGNVGYCTTCRFDFGFALDDLSVYYDDPDHPGRHLAASVDPPGGVDGEAFSPLGVSIYPPENIPADSLIWTFEWYPGGGGGGPSDRDGPLYEEISSGRIRANQQTGNGSQFVLSFGPVDMEPGDTLSFVVGIILGEGEKGMLANADRLDWLIEQDFKVPSAPPPPPLRVETLNHRVVLNWSPTPDADPEAYTDPYRADNDPHPFEGYRVYKSTRSPTGPWTLLAEYDTTGDPFGHNTGLKRTYTDVGLLNNLEYYYSVTAYSKPDTTIDFPSLESSINANAKVAVPGTEPPSSVDRVAVVPNPYRGDIAYHAYDPPWEKPDPTRASWMEQDRRIQFINLPARSEITIYTLAGDWIISLYHDDPTRGYEDWNLTSRVGQAISSGIYLYTVKDNATGQVHVGKFVVIK